MDSSSQQKKVHFPSMLFVTLIFSCILVSLFEVFYPKTILALNRNFWEQNKPEKYYVKVHAFTSFGCSWTWEAIVQEEVPTLINENTFHSNGRENSCSELGWFLTGNKISIDHIFNILEQSCVDQGFMDCGSTFDANYHFPQRSESYETYIIEIEDFKNCEIKESCP